VLNHRAANKNADASGHRNEFSSAQAALFSTESEKNLWESWRKKVAIMRHRHRLMPVNTSFPPLPATHIAKAPYVMQLIDQ
jgi:hypothetical protein